MKTLADNKNNFYACVSANEVDQLDEELFEFLNYVVGVMSPHLREWEFRSYAFAVTDPDVSEFVHIFRFGIEGDQSFARDHDHENRLSQEFENLKKIVDAEDWDDYQPDLIMKQVQNQIVLIYYGFC